MVKIIGNCVPFLQNDDKLTTQAFILPSDNVPVGHLVPLGEYLEVGEVAAVRPLWRGALHVPRDVVAIRVGEVDDGVEVGAAQEELLHRPRLRVVAIPRRIGLVLPVQRLEMQLRNKMLVEYVYAMPECVNFKII